MSKLFRVHGEAEDSLHMQLERISFTAPVGRHDHMQDACKPRSSIKTPKCRVLSLQTRALPIRDGGARKISKRGEFCCALGTCCIVTLRWSFVAAIICDSVAVCMWSSIRHSRRGPAANRARVQTPCLLDGCCGCRLQFFVGYMWTLEATRHGLADDTVSVQNRSEGERSNPLRLQRAW